MKRASKLACWSVCLVLACGGCAQQIYDHSEGSGLNAVSSYKTWKITGDLQDLPKAIDDSVATAATSSGYYDKAGFTIDLGKPSLFNMVVIDQGARENGFPRQVAVYTSMDGQNFTHQYQAPGTRRVTVLNWVTPVLARYVRMVAVGSGDQPWSVAEVYIR